MPGVAESRRAGTRECGGLGAGTMVDANHGLIWRWSFFVLFCVSSDSPPRTVHSLLYSTSLHPSGSMLSSVPSILAFVCGEAKEQALLLSVCSKSSMRTSPSHLLPPSFFFFVTQHFECISEAVAGEMKSASTKAGKKKEKVDSGSANKRPHETRDKG